MERHELYYIDLTIKRLESEMIQNPGNDPARINLERAREEKAQLERWIDSAPADIRTVLDCRLRHGMTWMKIGDRVFMDGSAVRRKALRYVRKHPPLLIKV